MDIGFPNRTSQCPARHGRREGQHSPALHAALKAHWLTGIGTVLKNYIMFSGEPSVTNDADSHNLGAIWNLPFIKGKTRLVLVDALTPSATRAPSPIPIPLALQGAHRRNRSRGGGDGGLRVILKKREGMRGEPWPLSPPPLCVEAADKDHGLGPADGRPSNLCAWDGGRRADCVSRACCMKRRL